MKNIIANILTICRALLGPFIFFLLVIAKLPVMALTLTLFSSLTDYLDGYFARKFESVSNFGKIFDPLADKVLIIFCFIALIVTLQDTFVAFCSALIISREILISGIREYASSIGSNDLLSVSFLAKIKTTIQLITICFYQIALIFDVALLVFITHWILLLATLITIKTGIDYFKRLH